MFRYNRKQAGWQKRVELPFHPVNFSCRRAPAPAEALLDSTAIKWYRRRNTAVQTTGFRAISLRLKTFWGGVTFSPFRPSFTRYNNRNRKGRTEEKYKNATNISTRRFPHQSPWYAPDEFTTSALFLLCCPALPALFLPPVFSLQRSPQSRFSPHFSFPCPNPRFFLQNAD